MDLQELLKKYLEEDKITSLLNDMKSNKIFTASEENLDTRYQKLKGDFDTLTSKSEEDVKLIEQLKEASKGNEEMQKKFGEYDSTIAKLQAENEQLKIDNEIKVELLASKAKAKDLDYLIFKIKQKHQDVTLDENGKIKGINFEDIKSVYPDNFEVESKKEVDVNKLPNINDKETTISKEEFDSMGYQSRLKLKQDDPDTYKELIKK